MLFGFVSRTTTEKSAVKITQDAFINISDERTFFIGNANAPTCLKWQPKRYLETKAGHENSHVATQWQCRVNSASLPNLREITASPSSLFIVSSVRSGNVLLYIGSLIPPTNYHLLAAKQEPYKKASRKYIEEFSRKKNVGRMRHKQKEQRNKRGDSKVKSNDSL